MQTSTPRIFKTYDPTDTGKYPRKWGYYAVAVVFIIIFAPIAYFMPNTEGRIVTLAICIGVIVSIFALSKYYNTKYNGGAEVRVTRELVEIKLPNSQRKVFSINSIKKIKSHDNSSAEYIPEIVWFPLLLTITIWTSSSLGKVRLRFQQPAGGKFINEI